MIAATTRVPSIVTIRVTTGTTARPCAATSIGSAAPDSTPKPCGVRMKPVAPNAVTATITATTIVHGMPRMGATTAARRDARTPAVIATATCTARRGAIEPLRYALRRRRAPACDGDDASPA